MKKRTIIALVFLILSPVIIPYLVHRPLLLYLDKNLSEKASLLKEGMSEQEVLKIMGKPKEKEFIDLRRAVHYGLPDNISDKFGNPDSRVLMYGYYVPFLVFFYRPFRTWIRVFFDEDKEVVYIIKTKVLQDDLFPLEDSDKYLGGENIK